MQNRLPAKPDDQLLRHLYVEQGLTQAEIGRLLGVSQNTIRRYLNLYNIPSRPQGVAGSRNPRARLTEEQVREIKSRLVQGATLKELSTQFSVSVSTIESIAIGRTWKHVPIPFPEKCTSPILM